MLIDLRLLYAGAAMPVQRLTHPPLCLHGIPIIFEYANVLPFAYHNALLGECES